MPDLERSSVLNWLQRSEPRIASEGGPLFRPVEDLPEVRALLTELGESLDAVPAARAALSEDAGELAREVMAQLGMARMLRLVEWLDGRGPAEAAGQELQALLLRNEDTEAGRLIRTTLQVLHRRSLLDCIFAPDRVQALLASLAEPEREAA